MIKKLSSYTFVKKISKKKVDIYPDKGVSNVGRREFIVRRNKVSQGGENGLLSN